MKISITDLSLDPKNARKHSARNLEAIAASLEKFGQRKPIVVHRGVAGVRPGEIGVKQQPAVDVQVIVPFQAVALAGAVRLGRGDGRADPGVGGNHQSGGPGHGLGRRPGRSPGRNPRGLGVGSGPDGHRVSTGRQHGVFPLRRPVGDFPAARRPVHRLGARLWADALGGLGRAAGAGVGCRRGWRYSGGRC